MTNDAEQPLEGGCACGTFATGSNPGRCSSIAATALQCQTETGSAFVINALIEPDRVTLLAGAPEAVATPSESGKGQIVWRCPACRVAFGAIMAAPAT